MPEAVDGESDLELIIAMRRGEQRALDIFKTRHRALFERICRGLYENVRDADAALHDLMQADLGSLFAGFAGDPPRDTFATFALTTIRDSFLFSRLKSRMAADPRKYFHDFQALFRDSMQQAARRYCPGNLSEDILSGIKVKLFENDCRQLRKWAAEANGLGYVIDKINWLALDEIKKQTRGVFQGPPLVAVPTLDGGVVEPDEDPNGVLPDRPPSDVGGAIDLERIVERLLEIGKSWSVQERVYLSYVLDLEYAPREIARAMRLTTKDAEKLRRVVIEKMKKACRNDRILMDIRSD